MTLLSFILGNDARGQLAGGADSLWDSCWA